LQRERKQYSPRFVVPRGRENSWTGAISRGKICKSLPSLTVSEQWLCEVLECTDHTSRLKSSGMTEPAVDAFSKAFSSSSESSCARQHIATFAARARTTIHNIPAEVLCAIFDFVDEMEPKHYPAFGYWLEKDRGLERYLMSASLFPYAPASVCSFWRDAMSTMAKCWDLVVIFVDPPATPLSVITSQLSWSRNGQLDVFIIRRAFHNVDGRHERSQVIAIMNIIVPHIHRIRDLRINVMFSSSLPSILRDFHGTATMMLNLQLQCMEDDGGVGRTESVALTDLEEFQCPNLQYLVIDGRNCYEASRSDPQWTDKIANIWRLAISHFHPNPGESFSTQELLLPFLTPKLDKLRITDLVLHPSHHFGFPNIHLFSVEFEDLHSFELLHDIIGLLDEPYDISFTRCILEDITDELELNHFAAMGDGGVLKLTKIDHDLAPLLRLWRGDSLSITDCPRFDDALLDAMTFKDNEVFNCAIGVDYLTIQDCPNFSVAALRRFVESRSSHVNDIDKDLWVSPICSIQFYGNVPSMSQEEQAWFDANVNVPREY
jgi:hypothetical protein